MCRKLGKMSGTVNGWGRKISIIELEAYKRSEREGLKYRGLGLAFRAHIRYFLLRHSKYSTLTIQFNVFIQSLVW